MRFRSVALEELPQLIAASVDAVTPTKEREHGTRARYVLGSGEDGPCRCDRCSAANSTAQREREHAVEPAYVSAIPAREHVLWLRENGVGMKTVSARGGVPHGTLSKLLYGDAQRGMGPSKRIRRTTHERIMRLGLEIAAPGSRVPAGPTLAAVERLVAAGVPKARIAERIGQRGPGLQLGREVVTRRTADAITAMLVELEAGTLVTIRRHRNGDTVVAPDAQPTERPHLSPFEAERLQVEFVEMLEERLANRDWLADAACRNRPVWMWFPARGDHRTAERALRICRACIVRARCLEVTLDQRDGITGGLTEKQRRALRERRSREVAA